jgi:hypothetical protein
MPRPRIEVPRMQPIHFGYKLSKHERMSIVVAVDCETQRTPEPYHKPCLSSPTEPTEHHKIEGLTHADLADMRRGTIIFTGNSQRLSGQIVAPQKMECRRGHDIECLQINPRNSFCQFCGDQPGRTPPRLCWNSTICWCSCKIGRCRVNATSKQPKSSSC